MKRVSRRFDLFLIGISDVERMEAWKAQDRVCFTYEQSLRLRRVRKRNTFLFDALADIAHQEYRVTEGVLEDMLYETVLVDFHVNGRAEGHVRCQKPADPNRPHILPAEELKAAMYEHGFYITGPNKQQIHFVPFVASASMSREEEYLFVNSERLDELLRAVTLDMVSAGEGEYALCPVLNGAPADLPEGAAFGALQEQAAVASVPKLAAYMGLALSDGISLRERWAAKQKKGLPELPELTEELWSQLWMLGLNERNTVCVNEWETADTRLSNFDCCWVNEIAPRKSKPLKSTATKTPTAVQRTMGQLFAALKQPKEKKQEYIDLLSECEQGEKIVSAWREAIDAFVKEPGKLNLDMGRIPLPPDGVQGTSTYSYAIIYAMYLLKEDGQYILSKVDAKKAADQQAEDAADTASAVVDIEALKDALSRVLTEENLRNRLWNLLHEENQPEYRMIEVKPVGENAQVTLCKRPAARYRAVLQKVSWGDTLNLGNLYDGCGFLDDSIFELLEAQLRDGPRPPDEDPLNAVQIRLPWCKGLMVRFSAAEFFKQWAEERGCSVEELKILDAFGATRNVLDADGQPVLKAVFTTSMFKGWKWFAKLTDQTTNGEQGDHWAEYWRRLWAHRASLLIAGKSTSSGTTSRLNYQFLSTMGLSDNDLYQFVAQHLHMLGEAQHSANAYLSGADMSHEALVRVAKVLMGQMENAGEDEVDVDDILDRADDGGEDESGVATPENDPDEPAADEGNAGDETGGSYVTQLIRAMEKNPEQLVGTTIVRNRFTSLVQSELLHMMRGRLPVKGDVRYLVPDLLAMVRYMAGAFLRDRDGNPLAVQDVKYIDVRAIRDWKTFKRTTLLREVIDRNNETPYGRYYAPGDRVPWKADKAGARPAVTVLRNPHYAMGEEPVLSPLPEYDWKAYDSWFGQLKGCVMTSQAVMYTINGADCDGDRVNVCAEPCVVEGLRKRARLETRLLKTMITRKTELEKFLEEQLSKERLNQDVRKYLKLLQEELPNILWKIRAGNQGSRDYLPPLIYAGSASKGKSYSRAEMMTDGLKAQLWKTFSLASQQSIGKMSLDVLKMTADAYGSMRQDEDLTKLDVQKLLGRFVARYLVVCKALDTAMEIDMAKTGATCDKHEIKTASMNVLRFFGLGQKSGYYTWRSLFKKYKSRLKGYGFDRALEKMMKEFNEKKTDAEHSPLALDRLPVMVYRLWAPEQAKATNQDWKPLKDEAEDPLMIRAGNLLDVKSVPVRDNLPEPDPQVVERLEAPDKAGITLLKRIEELVIRYDVERRRNIKAQEASERIAKSYHAVMEWLLRNGRGLDDALKDMSCIQRMLDRWFSTPSLKAERLRDVLVSLQKQLETQSTAILWGWSGKEERIALLRNALAQACVKTGAMIRKTLPGCDRAPAISFRDEECELLAGGRRSVALVLRVLAFAWHDAALHMRSGHSCSMSIETLEARIKATVRAAAPLPGDEALCKELYYAACFKLFQKKYIDGAGRNTEMMSEFLMTYLLRDMLGRKLAVYGEFDDITGDSFELPDADLNDDDDGKGETKQ